MIWMQIPLETRSDGCFGPCKHSSSCLADFFSSPCFLITIKKEKLRTGNSIQAKILTLPELQRKLAQWRTIGKTVAFTNGCFDILHAGHIASLTEAARHADMLIVGLNADASVHNLKGKNRPINNEQSRALLMASLCMVDAVVIFSEPTPL